MRVVVAIAIAFLFAVSSSSGETNGPMKQRASNLPGGYAAIPDLTDPRVQVAASFAVKALVVATDPPSSPKQPEFTFAGGLNEDGLHITVVRGFRQVVAGMNYDLVLVLSRLPEGQTTQTNTNGDKFVGSFRVTIYDHFGNLSVTKWGQEYTEAEVQAMREHAKESPMDGNDSDWKDYR